MIDDQLNAEFGGNASTDLAMLANPGNSVVTPNTASQVPGQPNQIGILHDNFGDFSLFIILEPWDDMDGYCFHHYSFSE